MEGAQYISAALGRVFAITLHADKANPAADPPVLLLEELAQELAAEGGEAAELLLNSENLERVLWARLSLLPTGYPQTPLQYLLGSYARAGGELRAASALKDAALQARACEAMTYARGLVVSYTGLMLNMEMFPQPPEQQKRGTLQLLDAMDASSSLNSARAPSMPVGFLEELAARFADESLPDILQPILMEVAMRASRVSVLGDFQQPLQVLCRLLDIKPVAAAVAGLQRFLPLPLQNGRAIQEHTLFGPFFSVGVIPDYRPFAFVPQPDVQQQCFSDLENRRQADLMASIQSLRSCSGILHTGLHTAVHSLLKNKDTRGAMLDWMQHAISSNAERAKMRIDFQAAATHAFFCNLSVVLLKLCDPFVDPASGKAWQRLDAAYVSMGDGRVDFSGDTKLGVSSEEEAGWLERRKASLEAGGGGSGPGYHFIADCFFLTARALHIGVVKVMNESMQQGQDMHRLQRDLGELEAAQAAAPPGTPQAAMLEERVRRYKAAVGKQNELRLCFETTLLDPALLQSVLAYYRLMAAWLMRLASPSTAAGQRPQLPLTSPPPMEFSMLPEYFVEDLIEALIFASRMAPQVLELHRMEEYISFIVVFLGSHEYIKNPYLRSRLAEALMLLLPPDALNSRRGYHRPAVSTSVSSLLESDPMVLEYLVPALLRLYVDVEHTGRNTEFYEKFNIRQNVGEILEYTWNIPLHKEAWKKVGEEEGRGLYRQFAHMLLNDAIYLLDESLKQLPQMKEIETAMADAAAWSALPQQERQEREQTLQNSGRMLRDYLMLSGICVRTLCYSTEEITAPFLLPEMVDRCAGMLNYFLLYLTGPQRKKLKIKDPEKYGFRPKELLTQIIQVYLHLYAADAAADGVFVKAVAADDRSYRPEMFSEAAAVLQDFGLVPQEEIELLQKLAAAVEEAVKQGELEDEELGEVPDEFLDPIYATLMKDPVLLPSSKQITDRAIITRHLLSDPIDPFNRQPLKAEDLVPATELKAKIDAWIADAKARKAAGGAAPMES
eukprot:jgi/Tetstr1/421585/TSEL_012529.t1